MSATFQGRGRVVGPEGNGAFASWDATPSFDPQRGGFDAERTEARLYCGQFEQLGAALGLEPRALQSSEVLGIAGNSRAS